MRIDKDKRNDKRGFTLIELLVVIGILAALAAVAMPVYFRFFGQGEAESNSAELSHVQAAMDAMLAEGGLTLVDEENTWTNDFSASPTGDGVLPLYPNFLRNNLTKCHYTWNTAGRLQQSCQ